MRHRIRIGIRNLKRDSSPEVEPKGHISDCSDRENEILGKSLGLIELLRRVKIKY
jgi:hypothetical protein